MKPFLSVLIPCRNEARFLARCLDSILANDYPPDRMEVLVIDGRSTDGTREVLAGYKAARYQDAAYPEAGYPKAGYQEAAYPEAGYQRRDARVRLIDNPDGITPCALNRGIDVARGEIIARVDAHAAVAPDYFRLCVDTLLSSGADNVGGVMRTLPRDSGCFAEPIVAALGHRFGVGNSYFRVGSSAPRWVDTVFGGCWRREVFERIGRFNPALRRSQDMEFSLRLKARGGRTLLAPVITSDYYARSRMGPFWRHNFTNGEWAVLPFLYSSVIPVRLRHLIPLLFVMALVFGLLLAPWTGWPLAGVALPYALLNLTASGHVALRHKHPRFFVLMPLVFLSLHAGYGLGSLWGLFQAAALCRPSCVARSEETTCLPQP